MQLLQRVRDGGSRIDNGLEQWAPEGEGKSIYAEYLRRGTYVSGKECDGTLQEVGLFFQVKQGGTAG